jgi:hypothetical protein
MLNILGHKGNVNQNDIEISLTPIRMSTINNTNKNKYWGGCGEKEKLTY